MVILSQGEYDCPDCEATGNKGHCDRCAGLGRIYIDREGDEWHTAPPCDCGCEAWNEGICLNCGCPVEGP